MESVGEFEYHKKDLIGHGAFAVVFKGRHKLEQSKEVAIKCISRKNLAKSQTLLGKEIRILKELEHENIVALYDCQETPTSVFLVMEYCNGGDLADYLQAKGTLSEGTLQLFLRQIASALRLLNSKGVIHRDLKPQNILLTYGTQNTGWLSTGPTSIRLKIADFGFARYLQSNMLAGTLCGSPMYMAPEVIMSQHYDAKADLWSVGTILFQCLTGTAPFQASSPQNLRLFYEKNKNLTPSIPSETSPQLKHLLLRLLKRNQKDRMDFDEFFSHPFLEGTTSMKKSLPITVPVSGCGTDSSCSSSTSSQLTSPQSGFESQRLAHSPALPSRGVSSVEAGVLGVLGGSGEALGSSGTLVERTLSAEEDFVMVPRNLPSDFCGVMSPPSALLCRRASAEPMFASPSPSPSSSPATGRPLAACRGSGSSPSRPSALCILASPQPVPSQVLNYQRMEQQLNSPTSPPHGRTGGAPVRRSSTSPHGFLRLASPGGAAPAPPPRRRSLVGLHRPHSPFPLAGLLAEPSSSPSPPRSSDSRSRHSFRSPGAINTSARACAQVENATPSPPRTRGSGGGGGPSLPTILGSPTKPLSAPEFTRIPSSGNLVDMVTKQGLGSGVGVMCRPHTATAPIMAPLACTAALPALLCSAAAMGRSHSSGNLSDQLLQPIQHGGIVHLVEPWYQHGLLKMTGSRGSSPDSLGSDKPGHTAMTGGRPIFTVGSPPRSPTPPRGRTFTASACSACGRAVPCSPSPPAIIGVSPPSLPPFRFAASPPALEGAVMLEPPELPEETLMEREHTDTLHDLSLVLDFARGLMIVGDARSGETGDLADYQQSSVTDQISQFSRNWGAAERLLLYMKAAEVVGSVLHLARERVNEGRLSPTAAVKKVVRCLNEEFRRCVAGCRSLSVDLAPFLAGKQRLMSGAGVGGSVTAEHIAYSYALDLVRSAALDEMFRGDCGVRERYRLAARLLEGLALILPTAHDAQLLHQYKQHVEQHLSAMEHP